MDSEQSGLFSVVIAAGGKPVRFALDDVEDEVQAYLVAGEFYEKAQLDYHGTLIPRGGRILDIGANIGNHSVYYAVVCNAESVISVEPNERACQLFRRTVEWNRLESVTLVCGVAAGAGDGWATLDDTEANHHNLGGTSVTYHLKQVEGGIPVRTGDAILEGQPVDFIKIDVEGSEFEVLTGLQSTIHAQCPVLSVEVMPKGRKDFWQWCDENDYRIERTFQMYRGIMTYVCLPRR